MPRCPYCHIDRPTRAGVNYHISKKAACHEKWRASLGIVVTATREETEPPEHEAEPPEEAAANYDSETPPRAPSPMFFSHDVPEEQDDDDDGFIPPPRPVSPDLEDMNPGPRRATVEEVMDEDDPQNFQRFVESFPGEEPFPGYEAFKNVSATTHGHGETVFERMHADQTAAGASPHALFLDADEWELASWLAKNVSQTATDAYLKLPIVSARSERPDAAHLFFRLNTELACHTITTTRIYKRSTSFRQALGGSARL